MYLIVDSGRCGETYCVFIATSFQASRKILFNILYVTFSSTNACLIARIKIPPFSPPIAKNALIHKKTFILSLMNYVETTLIPC